MLSRLKLGMLTRPRSKSNEAGPLMERQASNQTQDTLGTVEITSQAPATRVSSHLQIPVGASPAKAKSNVPSFPKELEAVPEPELNRFSLYQWAHAKGLSDTDKRARKEAAARITKASKFSASGKLQIEQLDLTGLHELKALPPGLRVHGMLNVAGLRNLQLPDVLHVGSLDISDTNVRQLPRGLNLNDLLAANCLYLNELPADLVAHNLDISNTDVTKLPAGMTLSTLKANDCNIAQFPEDFQVTTALEMRNNLSFRAFPAGFKPPWDLRLDNCRQLTHLPDGCTGVVHVPNCVSLTGFPSDLHCFELVMSGCVKVRSLPASLAAGSGINRITANDCDELRDIPDNLYVRAAFVMKRCKNFTALPAGLHSAGTIDVSENPNLVTVPRTVQVGNPRYQDRHMQPNFGQRPAFIATNCDSLAELPAGWSLDGDLIVDNNPKLGAIPKDLSSSGDICARSCLGLKSVGDGIRAHRLLLDFSTRLTSIGSGEVNTLQAERCLALSYVSKDLKTRTASFRKCIALGKLHDDFSPSVQLDISDCTLMESAPARMNVQRFIATGCRALRSIPDTARVGRELHIEYTPNLKKISPEIFTEEEPRIFTMGAGLSDDSVLELTRFGLALDAETAPPSKPKTRADREIELKAFKYADAATIVVSDADRARLECPISLDEFEDVPAPLLLEQEGSSSPRFYEPSEFFDWWLKHGTDPVDTTRDVELEQLRRPDRLTSAGVAAEAARANATPS